MVYKISRIGYPEGVTSHIATHIGYCTAYRYLYFLNLVE